jgi:hypothetical protein
MSLKQSDVICLFKCVDVQTDICLVIVIFALQQNKKTKIKHIQHQLKLRNFVTTFCSFILKKRAPILLLATVKKLFDGRLGHLLSLFCCFSPKKLLLFCWKKIDKHQLLFCLYSFLTILVFHVRKFCAHKYVNLVETSRKIS